MKKVIRNKQFTRHFNEDYDDNVDALQSSYTERRKVK